MLKKIWEKIPESYAIFGLVMGFIVGFAFGIFLVVYTSTIPLGG